MKARWKYWGREREREREKEREREREREGGGGGGRELMRAQRWLWRCHDV